MDARDDTFPGEEELIADAAGDLHYVDAPPVELPELAEEDLDNMLVVTSFRLPLGLHRQLQKYAEEHGVKPSVLLRQWVELQLAAADKPIFLGDALRVLAALPSPRAA